MGSAFPLGDDLDIEILSRHRLSWDGGIVLNCEYLSATIRCPGTLEARSDVQP